MSAVERYTLTSLDDVPAVFAAPLPDGSVPRFNIAPLQLALIRTADALLPARWGLLPPWRGHGGKRAPHVLHAPLDAIEPTPLLRNAFHRQRCLVIADGFFVWRRAGKKPQPLWVHPAPDPARHPARSRTLAFAGLAATHRDDHQLSFALVVGAAPSLAALIGPETSAVPLVISPDDHAAWLTGPRDRAHALPSTPTHWRADAVSSWVNAPDHDDPRCIEPLGNPAQGELF